MKSDNNFKQISINQKPSKGYEIESIKYTIENNDSDSIFVQKTKTRYFNINSSVSPILSLDLFDDAFELSQFESNQKSAFPWMLTDSIMVETPSLIVDGKIFTDDRKLPYSNKLFQRDSRFKGQITDITLPQGQSEVIIKLEYRKRKVSYTLHLTNNRTKESKFISGKWIESAPTGNYEIEWQQ